MNLIRLQIVGEVVQLLRLIAIRWPPNVAEYFATSHIDPTSIMLPVDFTGELNGPLDDRNYSMPRVFDEYEISPFFSQNYNNESSNLLIWVPILGGGAILLKLLKKVLQQVSRKMDIPKKYDRKKAKYRYHFIKAIHQLNKLFNRVDDSTIWNLLFIFILSIYQPGNLWSLVNMRYASALLEPSTTSTRASLALGIIFFLYFLILLGLMFRILVKNMKYLIHTGGTPGDPQQEERLKKYSVLIDDFNRKKRLQILFLPISLLKSFVFVAVLALMAFSPIAQITLLWGLSTAFVLYLIIYQPLKVKWMRNMTLLIELLTYGCVTLALIFGIIERCADLDAVTLDEMGFVFLILTIGSTLGGVVLSLIQVLQLIKDIYQYLKSRRTNKNRVQPITPSALSELQITAFCPTPTIETREAKFQGKVIDPSVVSLQSDPSSTTKIGDSFEDDKILASIGKLSSASFKKEAKEQLMKELREWWNSARLALNTDTNDLDRKAREENTKDSTHNFIVDEKLSNIPQY